LIQQRHCPLSDRREVGPDKPAGIGLPSDGTRAFARTDDAAEAKALAAFKDPMIKAALVATRKTRVREVYAATVAVKMGGALVNRPPRGGEVARAVHVSERWLTALIERPPTRVNERRVGA
jgi:hypothetical protein